MGERNYAEECGDYGGSNRDGEPCGRPAGWGTDFPDGKCRHHRGTSPDGTSHNDNTNAVTHGLYAQTNATYQQVLTDDERQLVDDIFSDYLADYEARHGEATTGTRAELFRIAVSYGKHVHADRWAIEKPESLESGNAAVDRETHVSDGGETYYTYKETVVAKGQRALSRDRRAWLKDLGLMGASPDDRQASALEAGLDLTLSTDEKAALDGTFDTEPQT
ncbi:hypothetical protein [Halomarina rubra]|uniref:Uncharacterized protein n=1 Tax=Halomarina rubra TaxID=2071873 RepID=A0ABD6AZS6_9EURY|nr:hypothetical protein [Halomarina rubra]